MKRLNDLSQLDKSLVSTVPAPSTPPPKQHPRRLGQSPAPAPRIAAMETRIADLEKANADLAADLRRANASGAILAERKVAQRKADSARIADLETDLAQARAALADASRQLDEASRRARSLQDALDRIRALPRPAAPIPSASAILLPPADFREAFPGELREHVIEILRSASLAVPPDSRRADILSALLSAPQNAPSGALRRLRDDLLDVLRSIPSSPRPAAVARLQSLGVACVEGLREFRLRFASRRFSIPRPPTASRSFSASAPDIVARFFAPPPPHAAPETPPSEPHP